LHRNLTPGIGNKFLGRVLGAALIVAATSAAEAQDTTINLSDYQGPGVLSSGVGNIGIRSGEQVDLRYYAGISGSVDTNLQPFALDAQGNLLRIHNLYGIELDGGVYGVHSWKRSQLGLDYAGDYRKHVNSSSYDGSDQHFTLGYTLQSSRRWTLDFRESASTASMATTELFNSPSNDLNSAFTPATLLFDSRTTFLQSSANATYFKSARTSFAFGGNAFLQDQKSAGLSNSWGYNFTGNVSHRMSKTTTLGATYVHSHFEFPEFNGASDSNTYHGNFATAIGRFWTFSLEAGVTVSEVNSQFNFVLNPVLAVLFGKSTVPLNSYVRNIFPSGSARLQRRFRRATLGFNYTRELNSGNGVSGTARLDDANMSISYTAIRKLNIGMSGGYYSLASVGQNTGNTARYAASAGFTYTLGLGIHLSARYDVGREQVDLANYNRTSTRATLGLLFSPGTLPLALW